MTLNPNPSPQLEVREYRVFLYLWECHAITITAQNANEARELAEYRYQDSGLDDFTYHDDGVDEFYCEEGL